MLNKRCKPPDKILAGGGSCREDNKDSLIDNLHNKDGETIKKGNLLLLITDTRILIVEIINKGINIMEMLNKRILIVLQTGSSPKPGSCLEVLFVCLPSSEMRRPNKT